MQKRGTGEPRHERGVLDGVPEPEAAPAERVIGPVGAHRDSEREKYPCSQDPGPHEAAPASIDAPGNQSCRSKGKRDRKPDITQIEERRMDREPRVLQDWIEIAPFERRLGEAREW